jgi:hypothetical protein
MRENQKYLLTTIEVNNTGRQSLFIRYAYLTIEKEKRSVNNPYAFNFPYITRSRTFLDVAKEICDLHKVDNKTYCIDSQILDSIKTEYDFIQINELEEYMYKNNVRIDFDEKLKSQKINHIKEPGFYRISVIIRTENPENPSEYQFSYRSSEIIYIE